MNFRGETRKGKKACRPRENLTLPLEVCFTEINTKKLFATRIDCRNLFTQRKNGNTKKARIDLNPGIRGKKHFRFISALDDWHFVEHDFKQESYKIELVSEN